MRPDDGYVRIFDTTLRDGEQSPGATMTSLEKLEIARALSRLGVDVIEAGFPAASQDDLAGVRAVAEQVGTEVPDGRPSREPPIVCGLARAKESDIQTAWEAVKNAARPRIHTFLATSPIHREHKLRMSTGQVLETVRAMVAHARGLCEDIEFSAEDAARTEHEFLFEVVAAAIEAGATTINIPDTVGYTTPDEMGALIRGIREHVPGIERAILSVHCHDDLGMATANTLAAIANGARQAEVTINGIGERAGNTALEEVVMALATRAPRFGLRTGIDTTRIHRTSRLVSTVTGMVVQPNKAIVGANAFAHESGIHQDGMLKHGETYEIMRPESVGVPASRLVLGKHSGRHALGVRLLELGYGLEGAALDEAFKQFKALADRKKQVTDADLISLVSSQLHQPEAHYKLDGLQISCGTMGMPTATVRLNDPSGEVRVQAALGSGPVDACFKAIDAIVGISPCLLEYTVSSVTEGIDALGEVTVRIAADRTAGKNPQHGAPRERVFHGLGTDTDILVASAKAYLNALNRLVSAEPMQRAAKAS
jgi:2-isopropylmalate synthase